MRIKSLIISIAAVAFCVTAAAFELGKENAVIYCSKVNTVAANEMSALLNQVFGKKYKVVTLKKADLSKPGIYIGYVPAGVKYDIPADKKEFVARYADKDRLFLWGNDKENLKGSAFAAFDFLEKFAGVRFLWPGKLGTVAEKREPVTVKDGLDIFVPPFELRMTSSFTYGRTGLTMQERTEIDRWQDHHKVGRATQSRGSGFQHAFNNLLPRQVYGKEHPEYYSLITPERWIGMPKPSVPTRRNDYTVSGPWQVCTSNKEVRRIFAEKIAASKDGRIRSISPNDGYGFCECDNCKAQDGKDAQRTGKAGHLRVTNRMYDFAEDIAHQVYKLNPKARIGMFAYSFYDGVPDQKISFPPNMYLSYCYIIYRAEDKAAEDEINNKLIGLAATGAKVVGREYWGCHYTMGYPLSHSRKIDRNIKTLHKCNAAGIYGETGKNFSSRGTDLYILCKLAWNPELKREDILKDYCDYAFGKKASPVMYELFEKIEDWVESHTREFKTKKGENFKYYKNDYAEFNRFQASIFNEAFNKMCKTYLNKADKLADTADRKARVQFFRIGLMKAMNTTEVLRSNADLAAIGVNMPLTQPSANFITMEKSELMKTVLNALAANKKQDIYSYTYGHNFAFSRGLGNVISLRPWHTLAQVARIDILTGNFNYLVNGAFEYYGYSWDAKAVKGNAVCNYVTTDNCDAPNNFMVTSHAGQGVSLQTDLKPGAEVEVKQLRPIVAKTPMQLSGKMQIKCPEGDPEKFVTASFGKHKLELVWVDKGMQERKDWCEVRFKPITVTPGKYDFKFTVTNSGAADKSFNFDDLRLQLKEIKK